MPSLRPTYAVCPGKRLEVEVVQPAAPACSWSALSALVPEAAGGKALRIRVSEAQVRALPAAG